MSTFKELDTSFDWGFSAVSEDELESIKVLEQKASDLEKSKQSIEQEAEIANQKVSSMYKAILPLLNNLQKDPTKSYIYWPDRQKKIEQFKQVLLKIVNDN